MTDDVRNPPEKEQEYEDIRAVYDYIAEAGPVTSEEIAAAAPGPSTDADLAEMGLTRERQVQRIIYGLDTTGNIRWTEDGWVTA